MKRTDYDYRDLLQDYGNEYLQEYYPDDCIYEMDMVTEFITDVWEALRSAFFGYDWCPGADSDQRLREQFNPNKDYFAFNGYGNLVSIDGSYYVDWLDRCITESEFIDWCVERGYIDEDDEEDIDGVGLVSQLQSRFDSRKSFYGKAIINESNDGTLLTLISYDTPVATYDRLSGTLDVFGWYSNTTARHIREFANQLGIELPSGKDIKGRYQA